VILELWAAAQLRSGTSNASAAASSLPAQLTEMDIANIASLFSQRSGAELSCHGSR
jgi:hypothetical protein